MLASALIAKLRERGSDQITGVDVDTCDITQPDSLAKTFDSARPDLVINCAAFTNVDGCETKTDLANAVNGTGVANIAKACKATNAALVHYSTDYVFDGSMRRPLRPEDPTGPVSAYGKSKLLGETLLQQNAPARWMILRTAWLYGPNGPNFVNTIVNAARAGKPLRVVADQFGCPTFTHDLADATLNLLTKSATGIWHISNSGETNWFEFAKAILKEFAIDHPVEAISSADWKKIKPDSATRPFYSVFDVAPYAKLIGKPLPDWRDALHRYRLMTAV
jgi:dTDP-4-dehydrorhamnose reductase